MLSPAPPKLANRLLLFFLKPELAEEVMGDLEEKYLRDTGKSRLRARLVYWFQVVNYLRPFALRHSGFSRLNPFTMHRHNLLVSIRNFKRYKTTFFINIIGLSAGLACTLLIFLWVQDELAMDKFHANGERIFKVMSNHPDASGIHTWEGTPGLLVGEIQTSVPDVKYTVPSSGVHPLNIVAGTRRLKARGQFVG
jgi:putative ABC transport system permease protein